MSVFLAYATFIFLVVYIGKIEQTQIYNHSELLQNVEVFGTQKYLKIQIKEVSEITNRDLDKKTVALIKRIQTNRQPFLLAENEIMITEKLAIQLFKSRMVVGNLVHYAKKNYVIKKVIQDNNLEVYISEPIQDSQPITLYNTSNILLDKQINYNFFKKIVFLIFCCHIIWLIVDNKKGLFCLFFILIFMLLRNYLPNRLADYASWLQFWGNIKEIVSNLFRFEKTVFDISIMWLFGIYFLLFGIHLFFICRSRLRKKIKMIILRKKKKYLTYVVKLKDNFLAY
ncbi:hypothetical protein RyT2_06970 [Pseudolactococcus yaeyamensis]